MSQSECRKFVLKFSLHVVTGLGGLDHWQAKQDENLGNASGCTEIGGLFAKNFVVAFAVEVAFVCQGRTQSSYRLEK